MIDDRRKAVLVAPIRGMFSIGIPTDASDQN
jgi:hypothetical protein